jgi:RNA polymerase sigma-70 factor (ECF subfamily)
MAGALPEKSAEVQIIDQICEGKTDLFYSLIKPYQRTVFAVVNSLLNNAADSEDVTQEAFLKALKALGGFRRESRFSTWLIQIALNEARMRLRRNREHLYQSLDNDRENEENDYIPRDFADWREIPIEALARKELRQRIDEALLSLRPMYREVLVLRDIQHLSVSEAAEALEITKDLVKTRLLRARLQMREALAPGYDGSWTAGSMVYKSVRPW